MLRLASIQTTFPGSSFAALLINSMSCLVFPEPFMPIMSLTILKHSCHFEIALALS